MKPIIIPIYVTYKLKVSRFVSLNNLTERALFISNSSKQSENLQFDKLNIIWNERNLGYGGGANLGIRKALQENATWVVILNQDLNIKSNFFKEFTEYLSECEPSIVGPFTGDLDNNRWSTLLNSPSIGYISGSCMAIHKDVISSVGLFYEPYFMYYEDVDYSIRATQKGFRLVKYNTDKIHHDDNPTLGKGSFLHEYYLNRNHMILLERLAPINIKLYEQVRIPKTVWEYYRLNNIGGITGIKDYYFRRFGENHEYRR